MFLVPPGNHRREARHQDEYVDFEVPGKYSGSLSEAQAFAARFAEANGVTFCTVVAEPILAPIMVAPTLDNI